MEIKNMASDEEEIYTELEREGEKELELKWQK